MNPEPMPRRLGLRVASLLALIAFSQAQISSAEGVERDFVAGAEGVVLDVEEIVFQIGFDQLDPRKP